ncbi:MAG TPA: nucleotidyltransferase family protein [Thermoanaerobaculia bacterium]|nr:nucleotidyltransferase family protein [Thermoanaerobaculia bacterium]
MTPEDRLLCLCARQEFLPAHQEAVERLCRDQALRWDRAVAAAERHGVLPIVGANLRRCGAGLPAAVAERLEAAIFENAAVRERDADRLATGLARLREVELEAMLLKGAALSLAVYEEPWVVASVDIDLSLRPGPGWEKGKGEEKAVRRALYTHGVECDLEGHHDVTMNGTLPVDFERIWREARPVRFRGVDAWVMSPEDLMISLCVNACRKRFFRLKALFDVAETLRRGEALDWPRLAGLAREGHCEGIVYTALVAARETLGARLPPGALETLRLSPPRAGALRRMIAAFLRFGSLGDRSGRALALTLTYASLRPAEAWKSLAYSLTTPPKHKGEDPYSPLPAGTGAAAAGNGSRSAGSPSRS